MTRLATTLALATAPALSAAPVPHHSAIAVNPFSTNASTALALAHNPADGLLYLLHNHGRIDRLDPALPTSTTIYTAVDHGIASPAGIAFGPGGHLFLTSNTSTDGNTRTTSTVTRGALDPDTGTRTWSTLAETSYPGGSRLFSHRMNAVAVSDDGTSVFVNIGARTDHGEVQSDRGTFPTARETGITTVLLELPSNATNLVLPDDREALRTAGYLFAEGLRNTYSIAFDRHARLFGVENGPDRDDPEELNWLRRGHHYGFPWRMGIEDNPQQFPTYNPAADKLLNPNYAAVARGMVHNDPTFPPPPAGVTFTDPLHNTGPHADKLRDPATGDVVDATDAGLPMATFTAHRSPLGLCFDRGASLPPPFTGGGFTLSWTPVQPPGSTATGPFDDASEDLLHLVVSDHPDTPTVAVTRIVSGFTTPRDAALVGDTLYVLDGDPGRTLWRLTFAPPPPPTLTAPAWTPEDRYRFTVTGQPGTSYTLEFSPDLLTWLPLTTFDGDTTPLDYTDPTSAPDTTRFYRARPDFTSP